MKNLNELRGKELVAKVKLHNYRAPKHNIESGAFAVVVLDLVRVLEGDVPFEFEVKGQPGQFRFIAKGKMPKLDKDQEYTFHGTLVIDPEWGGQYNVETIYLGYDMDRVEDQRKFFSYFLTDKQIDMLFELGDNPVQYLATSNIGKLTEVKGIGKVTATRMCMKYAENKNNGRAYIELKELGLTKHAIDSLIEQFGTADSVIDIIKENPYSLIKLVRGYGWEKCDVLALKQGFTTDCRQRVLAYAMHHLSTQADVNGNSCVDIEELMSAILEVCAPIDRMTAKEYLVATMWKQEDFDKFYKQYLKDKSNIYKLETPLFFYSNEEHKVGLFTLRLLEKNIVTDLQRLQEAEQETVFERDVCERIISETEEEQGWKYTTEQKAAIWNILNDNVSILTGSAGTGKSSTLRPLIRIFQHYGLEVDQTALSGRASSLLSEITEIEGKTIHRLLCYDPNYERFTRNSTKPLDSDVVVLDETSMVGEELFLALISAIKTGAKLIMLGDVKQLPPMAVGNILNDCIQSGYIRTNILTIIQRQALQSGIIAQSINVCQGQSIVKNDFIGTDVRGELKDFKLITNLETALVHHSIIQEFKNLYEKEKINKDDIQVVVPVKLNGDNSCRVLNAEIQQIVNPDKEGEKRVEVEYSESRKYTVTYKIGDRIIVNKNNYHATSLEGTEIAIFNGNIGHIVDIGPDYMVLDFPEQGMVILPRDDWWNINLAYAITCHKLQGSQSAYCIVGVDYTSFILLTREWLYTALTRAKKHCTLVGQPKAINQATRTSSIRQKQTWLLKDLSNLYMERIEDSSGEQEF